jgi:hypothetical protein
MQYVNRTYIGPIYIYKYIYNVVSVFLTQGYLLLIV